MEMNQRKEAAERHRPPLNYIAMHFEGMQICDRPHLLITGAAAVLQPARTAPVGPCVWLPLTQMQFAWLCHLTGGQIKLTAAVVGLWLGDGGAGGRGGWC